MKPNQANRSSSNEKQKDFLNRIYEEGGEDRGENEPTKCCKGDEERYKMLRMSACFDYLIF